MPEQKQENITPTVTLSSDSEGMVSPFIIRDSMKNKISFYHLVFFLISLPFDRFYSILILISFLLHGIIHATFKDYRSLWNRQMLVLTAVFLVTLTGIAWSADKGEGFKDLQRQLAIVLLPLALQLSGLDLNKYRNRLLHVFGFTCTIIILYLFADAFRIIRYNGMPFTSLFSSSFINHNFAEPIGMHATYLSMYAALSLAAFLVFILQENNTKRTIIYTIAVLILLAGLIQLASRSVLIATFLFTLTGIPFLSGIKVNRIKFGIIAISASLVILLIITGVGPLQKRYVTDFKQDLTINPVSYDNREPRVDRWKCALELFQESPLTGKGSGSEKRLLKEKYYEKKLFTSYLMELNAHNQYLSFAVRTGVAGLLVFLATLAIGMLTAIKRRDPVFFSFMILVAVVSFSENLLDVNKGIFFYAFFFSLFLLSGKPFSPFSRLKH